MSALFRRLVLALVRLYYPRVAVSGALPGRGPVVLVANHPNGLLDPLVLRIAAGRPVAFLAKSTFFATALGRWVMGAFDALPVYRAHEADTRRNEETFARCADLLGAGGWLALFPEGKSHDAPGLERLKTGAARIALATPGVRVVPAGLLYEEKDVFRTRVSVAFGEPIEPHAGEPVDALTARIAEGLGEVVLQAEDREVWRGFVAVAGWTSEDGGEDLAAVHARAQRLADRYRALAEEDPARLGRIVAAVRHFARMLDAVGVRDPFALESPRQEGHALATLVATAPLAAIGAALNWIPYRAVRPVAQRLAGAHLDVVSTYKLMLGAVVMPLAWITEAAVADRLAGGWAAVGVLAIAPATGFFALRWDERVTLRREALRARWLASAHAPLAEAVAARRAELASEVMAALAENAASAGA
ncbi:MAG: 1-acyl-sn-glycerol-3-phosphate acyltransferase [Myxococcota bacterium]